MAATPYIVKEVESPMGGRTLSYVFSRGVTGLVRITQDESTVYVFLSFPEKADYLMWEPKRVLPLLDQFSAQVAHSIDCWALQFPASVATQAIQELDSIIERRSFYA
jgi:hypothetical protein